MGVVVRRYIDFLILLILLTCISSFLQQHPYFFVHFKNVFSHSCLCYFCCNIANVAQRTFEIAHKSRSR